MNNYSSETCSAHQAEQTFLRCLAIFSWILKILTVILFSSTVRRTAQEEEERRQREDDGQRATVPRRLRRVTYRHVPQNSDQLPYSTRSLLSPTVPVTSFLLWFAIAVAVSIAVGLFGVCCMCLIERYFERRRAVRASRVAARFDRDDDTAVLLTTCLDDGTPLI
ncbi:unnamed protein product [Caenorhabditis sp. 36 PRJEB53466]|nr:unnamed protein product [Caenorhabditis sp. 36 PRJEB53466]